MIQPLFCFREGPLFVRIQEKPLSQPSSTSWNLKVSNVGIRTTCSPDLSLACKQALLFGRVKRFSRERASEGPLPASPLARETRFACPNRRACSKANLSHHLTTSTLRVSLMAVFFFSFFLHVRLRYIFKNQKKAGLQELGPRFTLKLRSLQRGTFDSKFGEYEWIHKVRQKMINRSI